MTVRRKPKNDSATEAARVLRVFDMLAEEMQRRKLRSFADAEAYVLLEVADRIAARTEDPE
jgi:hypothetical protein